MRALFDVPAPAKLNLFLHVTGRRVDGYHLLQSVFMLVDWCDTLHFELRDDGQISREDLVAPLPTNDLILRAARALQAEASCPLGAHIAIEKRIPAQAGMGGGSSDAASTLLALNRLWGLNLPLATLARLGLTLGADVPFFLSGRNAWVEGIGERLCAVEIPQARFLIVKPAAGLETSRIFSHPNLKRNSEAATISGFAADPFSFGGNDLQPVATLLCPQISDVLQWMRHRGLSGRMTGSGSAVFAHLSPGARSSLIDEVPGDWQVKECENLGVHPLSGWALSDGLSVDGVCRSPV